MSSPSEEFLGWYRSLPLDLRGEVAFFSLFLMPDYSMTSLFDEESVVSEFEQWIRKDLDHSRKSAARIICLRAIVDFFLHGSRSARSDWEEIKSRNEALLEVAKREENEGMIAFVTTMLERFPLRERQWRKAMDSWKDLCQGPLSDDELQRWLVLNPVQLKK